MMRTFFLTDFRPDAGAPVELFGQPTDYGLPLTHPEQLTADILVFAKS
jgi:hypothetical protein